MSDTKPLLVLQYPGTMSHETHKRVTDYFTPKLEEMGFKTLVLADGATVQQHQDLTLLIEALDRYTASVAVHTNAVRQNSEILTGLVTMLLTEEDQQDPDDEPMIGASMNSPRGR